MSDILLSPLSNQGGSGHTLFFAVTCRQGEWINGRILFIRLTYSCMYKQYSSLHINPIILPLIKNGLWYDTEDLGHAVSQNNNYAQ